MGCYATPEKSSICLKNYFFLAKITKHQHNACRGPVRPIGIYFSIMTAGLYIIPYLSQCNQELQDKYCSLFAGVWLFSVWFCLDQLTMILAFHISAGQFQSTTGFLSARNADRSSGGKKNMKQSQSGGGQP